MNPFWGNLYDTFKDRRYAALFFLSLLGLALLPVFLLGMTLYGVSRGCSALVQARANRRNRWHYTPLSRDELRIARSKLGNGARPIYRPAPRALDLNLKY